MFSADPSGICPSSSGVLDERTGQNDRQKHVHEGKKNPTYAPADTGNEPADKRGKKQPGDAAGSKSSPMANERRRTNQLLIMVVRGKYSAKAIPKLPMKLKKVNMPQFVHPGHAQRPSAAKNIAEDNIFTRAESGDGETRERAQYASDNNKKEYRGRKADERLQPKVSLAEGRKTP